MDDAAAFDNPDAFFLLEEPRPTSKAQRRAERRAAKREQSTQQIPPLTALTDTQAKYLSALRSSDQVFAIGGAGTGKTYLASRHAIRRLIRNDVDQVVIARPTVTKPKHRNGFLPGKLEAKQKPWLIPILDAFKADTTAAKLDAMTAEGRIEFLSFEHMRGRSISNAVIVLDEAQNCDLGDLRLFLTRVGEGSQVIICGDVDQVDIEDSGLATVVSMIRQYKISASLVEFTEADVVRSAIAREWVAAFKKETNPVPQFLR